MFFSLVLFLSSVLLLSGGVEGNETCPTGMVWSECASACPLTCEHPNGPICEACGPGCACKEGTILKDPTTDPHVCVPPKDCPAQHICPDGMTWSDCATLCPLSCEHPDGPTCKACKAGCACDEGTILLNATSPDPVCVEPFECPQPCPTGMSWSECASVCPPTCEHPVGPICMACRPGCACNSGLILKNDTTSTVCIPEDDCPCDGGMEWTSCGTNCKTCSSPKAACSTSCFVGCQCPPGTILNDLVSPAVCVKKCPKSNHLL